MNIPENLRYTKDHEWIRLDKNVAVVGITEFAVEQLGDITLVEMPELGDVVSEGDTIGTIESVKAVSDMFAPISGTVKEINEELDDAPEKVNDSCYNEGWMMKIEVGNTVDIEKLFDQAGYKTYLDSLDD